MKMWVGLVLLSGIKFFSMTGDGYVNEKAVPRRSLVRSCLAIRSSQRCQVNAWWPYISMVLVLQYGHIRLYI